MLRKRLEKVTHLVFNKFFILIISVLVLFSNAIYANEDTDVLPVKQQLHDSSVCSAAAKQAGLEYGVSFDLLQTIASVESGKWDYLQNRYVAWPWTVNINGKGHYYSSKEEAVEETINMLHIYKKTCADLLALPVVTGLKTEKEKFAGAEAT